MLYALSIQRFTNVVVVALLLTASVTRLGDILRLWPLPFFS